MIRKASGRVSGEDVSGCKVLLLSGSPTRGQKKEKAFSTVARCRHVDTLLNTPVAMSWNISVYNTMKNPPVIPKSTTGLILFSCINMPPNEHLCQP